MKKNGRIVKGLSLTTLSLFTMFSLVGCGNNNETKDAIVKEEKVNYLKFVKGLKDFEIEKDSSVSFLEGISWNKDEILSVSVDAKDVKLNEVGTYDIVYTIDVKDKAAKDISKKYKVSVVDKTNKKEESKEEPKKEEVAKPTENKPTSNNEAKPSKKPIASTTTKPSTSKPTTSKPVVKPTHTHIWVEQFKTVHHDAQGHYEKVCVKDAWDEKVEKYDQVAHDICNGCGLDLTSNNIEPWKHMQDNEDCWGHHTKWVDVVIYETVHHEAIYENKWVVDKPAYDEKVLDGYKCSSCGAKK